LFVQQLATECLKEAKLERKPRRNIQYKDVANAVKHKDSLEFLEDLIPATVKYKDVKAAADAKRAQLRGEKPAASNVEEASSKPVANGKKHKASASRSSLNGTADIADLLGGNGAGSGSGSGRKSINEDESAADPNDQLEAEMRQARGDDVEMTG
jgi:DNA polymerase epsilon subunit 4